jgi:hypothetical protein
MDQDRYLASVSCFERDYDEINRHLREIAADLEMEPETLKRVYVGSGEDYSEELKREHMSL